MKLILTTAALALLLAAGAQAKGASEATIEGPGLDGRVAIPGDGEPGGGTTLSTVAELAGFFPSVFGQTPDATQDASPARSLGPRYTVRYVMPGPTGSSVIVQDLYPYAQPAPVTHMKRGQLVWPGQRTVGGWYLTTSGLKDALEPVGLPPEPPSATLGGGFSSDTPMLIAVLGGLAAAVVAVVALGVFIRRRRLQPAATG